MIAKGIREIIIGDTGHVQNDGFWEMHHFLVKAHGVTIRRFIGNVIDTSVVRCIGETVDATGTEINKSSCQEGDSQIQASQS